MNSNFSDDGLKSMSGGIHPNYDFINQFSANPVMIGILLLVVVLYYVVIHYSVNVDTGSVASGSTSSSMLETFLWILFFTILLLNGVRYFYDLDISTSIKGIFTKEPEVDISIQHLGKPIVPKVTPIPEIVDEKQVFHVSDNKYDFSDARAICAAYGGKLASYDQIEDAYNNGGEWCGYGWSEGQMALYPTQKKTYDKLQKIKGHEHDCGRPGVNGGYIANPKVKFGVNCYGYKPKMNETEHELMEIGELYPKTQKEINFDKKVRDWRSKLGEILVSPFNKTTWSSV